MSARSEAQKFVDGMRAGYDDCAAMAEALSDAASGLSEEMVKSGQTPLPPYLADRVDATVGAVLKSLAKVIRAKRAEMDRRTPHVSGTFQ